MKRPKQYVRRRLPADQVAPITGARLMLMRTEKLQISQKQLAEWLDLGGPHVISDWERGVRPVPHAVGLAVRWLVHLCQRVREHPAHSR